MGNHEQVLQALKKANEHKNGRAALKKAIRTGQTNVARVLSDLPPCANTMGVEDLLLACPGIGPHKANTLIAHLQIYGISHHTQLAGLTHRQRMALVVHLRDMFPFAFRQADA